jgi:prolyl-tRNA synthetase
MLLSRYFLPLLKDLPSEAHIASHSLMLRSGMIRQHASGIYNWLPIGHKVLENIKSIIRRNMNNAGFMEMQLSCIQNSNVWKESGRYGSYGKEMLKFTDRHDHELLFGPTAEEVFTEIVRNTLTSYRDLPKVLYQMQPKFRDEIRPRFGVMRGREFIMKDAYSVDLDHESAIATYYKIFQVYLDIFSDMGLRAVPLRAATGEIGGDLSHEFHIVAQSGESEIIYDNSIDGFSQQDFRNLDLMTSVYAVTDERYNPSELTLPEEKLSRKRGIEVGHIFNFGDKYSSAMSAKVSTSDGTMVNLQMGSYGIGVSRLPAAIIESSHDEKGIIWPIEVAPFKVSIVNLSINDTLASGLAKECYEKLSNAGVEVLLDDTNASAGSKFATHDLIGSPWQLIIGVKNAVNGMVELKNRKTKISELSTINAAVNAIIESIPKC